jgi:hypothetical protein
VKLRSSANKGPGGHIGKRVCNARDVEDGRWGRPGCPLPHGKSLQQPIGDGGGTPRRHPGGPCNGRRVVAADCNLSPFHFWAQDHFQDELVKEHPRHFKVGVSESTCGVGVGYNGSRDIFWPFHAPDNRIELSVPTKPYSSGTKCAGITIARICQGALDQLAHVSGAKGQVADYRRNIDQGVLCLAGTAQTHERWHPAESHVDWREEGPCRWEDSRCMLKPACNGSEPFEWNSLFPKQVADLKEQGFCAVRR